jgi:multiple antibiotic resistance protein
MIEEVIKFSVVFFAVVEPVSLIPIFAAMTEGANPGYARHMSNKAVLVAGMILVLFAFVGAPFLRVMGITLDAFRIFGGLVLFLIALDMVFVRQSGARTATSTEQDEARHRDDISVFPLAFPFIAGPGALATILLTFGAHARQPLLFAALLGVVAVVLLVTLILLRVAPTVNRIMGVTGANVIGRLSGVVLGALAVQYVIDGLKGSFG